MADYIERQTIIDTIHGAIYPYFCGAEDGDALSEDEKLVLSVNKAVCTAIKALPSVDAVEIVRCKDCKHWRRQTNYAGAQLSFGFCESDDMWRSLYGETYEVSHIDTDDDFYCSYGEREDG